MIRFARGAAHVAALVVAVASALLLVAVAVGPRTGRFQVITVLTGSMAPVAPQGSLAIVEPTPRTSLAVGDVIAYAIPVEDHHVVTHRIIELHEQEGSTVIRTKGDANDAPDPWVSELHDPTVWTERFAIPHAGHVITALRSPWTHRVGQLAPLLLAAAFVSSLWRKPDDVADAIAA